VDRVLKEYNLPPFYYPPSYHVSLAWCLGDKVPYPPHLSLASVTLFLSAPYRYPFNLSSVSSVKLFLVSAVPVPTYLSESSVKLFFVSAVTTYISVSSVMFFVSRFFDLPLFFNRNQCCETGMFIPDPGSKRFRIQGQKDSGSASKNFNPKNCF
jgi:hypothetical protein